MRPSVLSTVTCLGLTNFSTLFHKRNDFQKNVTEHKISVLVLSKILFEKKIKILRRMQEDTIINIDRSSCKVPVVLGRSELRSNVLVRFSINYSDIKFHQNPSSRL